MLCYFSPANSFLPDEDRPSLGVGSRSGSGRLEGLQGDLWRSVGLLLAVPLQG